MDFLLSLISMSVVEGILILGISEMSSSFFISLNSDITLNGITDFIIVKCQQDKCTIIHCLFNCTKSYKEVH